MQIAKLMKLLVFNVQQVGYYKFQKIIFLSVDSSDVFELSSAWLSSDSARAGGFSARLGSAHELFEPARLAKIGIIQAKIGKPNSKSEILPYLLKSSKK